MSSPISERRTDKPFYCKKPIPIETRQFTGDNILELQGWSNGHVALSDCNEETYEIIN